MLSSLVLCLAIPRAVRADEPQAERPAVRVVVDPRVELVSIIFRLAGHPEYSKGKVDRYTEAVEQRFGKFRDHAVVELARDLRRTRSVSYDACMSMAVHVTDAFDLKKAVPFDPYPADLDSRWGLDGAREFLGAARDFVRETSFREFVDEHEGLYQLTESRMRDVLDEHAHLEWFDEFFGSRPQAAFTVTSLLGQYESSREQYPTLEAFAPRTVEFFDDYAERFDAPLEPSQDE